MELMLPTGDSESGSLSGRENVQMVEEEVDKEQEERSLKRAKTFNWENGGSHIRYIVDTKEEEKLWVTNQAGHLCC